MSVEAEQRETIRALLDTNRELNEKMFAARKQRDDAVKLAEEAHSLVMNALLNTHSPEEMCRQHRRAFIQVAERLRRILATKDKP